MRNKLSSYDERFLSEGLLDAESWSEAALIHLRHYVEGGAVAKIPGFARSTLFYMEHAAGDIAQEVVADPRSLPHERYGAASLLVLLSQWSRSISIDPGVLREIILSAPAGSFERVYFLDLLRILILHPKHWRVLRGEILLAVQAVAGDLGVTNQSVRTKRQALSAVSEASAIVKSIVSTPPKGL